MLTVLTEYPIDDIMDNPKTYISNDETIDLFEFITSNGPVVVSFGYDSYNCTYYFVKTYPSFTYTVRCDKNELQSMYESILKEFSED